MWCDVKAPKIGALALALSTCGVSVAANDRLPPPTNVPSTVTVAVKEPASDCDVPQSLGALVRSNPALGKPLSASKSVCSSWVFNLTRLASTIASGGRKLEGERPLDLNAAARENQQALADPEFVADLEKLTAAEPDELRKKLLKAALLQDNGFFDAAQALLLEIKPVLKP